MIETVLTSIAIAIATALVTTLGMFFLQEKRLQREFELDRERLRTGFMAEEVAKQLLKSDKWKQGSFRAIQRRLGGFEDDELRKILVRAGAVRFDGNEGEELWGLLERNTDAL